MTNPTQQTNGTEPAAAPGGPLATQKRDQDGAMIFLSYFGIFALIPFLTVKDSDYIRWHAKQGLTFTVAWFALWVVATILGVVLNFIPIIGTIIGLLVWLGLGVGGFVLWLMAMIKAFGGERWKIPLIGDLADKW